MTSPSTDPQPEQTTGLTSGNSVPPGETPPGEASTSGVVRNQPDLPSAGANKVVYAVILGLTALGALTFVGYAVGLVG